MRKKLFASIAILFISCFIKNHTAAQNGPYKIDSIQAFLFYNSNKSGSDSSVAGHFSENIIDREGVALWNTPIGGGYAEGISDQLLVVVKISGNPERAPERILKLTAGSKHQSFFQQSLPFSIMNNASGYYAAFLFYNSGCDEIKLKAEIIHSYTSGGKKIIKTESELVKELLFHCGE